MSFIKILGLKSLFFIFLLLHITQIKATVHEDFSKLVCDILATCRNVKEANYDNHSQSRIYQTFKGKGNTIICLWYPNNEEKKITIDKSDWEKIHLVNYIMIGYGQTPTNPKSYYFILTKKIIKEIHLKKIEKYYLSFPIINHEF